MTAFFRLKLNLLVVAAILFSSCAVSFKQPIFSAKESKIDKRLLGKWQTTNEEGKDVTLEFTEKSPSQFNINSINESRQTNTALTAFAGKIGDHDYLNLEFSEDGESVYHIARYEITGDELSIWILDNKKLAKDLKQYKLKGEIASYDEVIIRDSQKNVESFLKSRSSAAVFKLFAKLKKIR